MNFSKEVHQIKTGLYTDTRLKSLFYGYLLDEKASKRNPWEELYTEGETALPKLLTDAQQKKLFDIEGGYKHCLQCAFLFSFPWGLCAAFQQYFTDDTGENAFQDWIEKRLPEEPVAKFHGGLLNHRNRCAGYLSKLEEEVDEAAKKYIRGIERVWNDRINGVLRYGFYLGYRCGLSAITMDLSLQEAEDLEKKILLTEVGLKITSTHWTKEALDQTNPYYF